MKRILMLAAICGPICRVLAATTFDPTHSYAYGANLGWVDAYGDGTNGAVVGECVCSGYFYGANVGWIHLGSGSPTNGIYYSNRSPDDFGVNQDGLGNLRGCAWGANIGWIAFEETGAPKVDLLTGNLSGQIYSANCGWISLTNGFAHLRTASFASSPREPSGLPLAWELLHFGHPGVSAEADADGDGQSNLEEYTAGTDPADPASRLEVTWFSVGPGAGPISLAWQSVSNRAYAVQKSLDLTPGSWVESGLGLIPSDGLSTARTLLDTNPPMRFYRIRAVRPLGP